MTLYRYKNYTFKVRKSELKEFLAFMKLMPGRVRRIK